MKTKKLSFFLRPILALALIITPVAQLQNNTCSAEDSKFVESMELSTGTLSANDALSLKLLMKLFALFGKVKEFTNSHESLARTALLVVQCDAARKDILSTVENAMSITGFSTLGVVKSIPRLLKLAFNVKGCFNAVSNILQSHPAVTEV